MSRQLFGLAILLLALGLIAGCAQVRPAGGEGRTALAACDGRPSCVVSRDDAGNRRIEALQIDASPNLARLKLMLWLRGQEGVEIVTVSDDYIHAVFITPRIRYRDDVEFLLHSEQDGTRIDVRSASRIGWYDWNANRNRVERMRRQLGAAGFR
ncbi:MAG: DUF1499 domain-containing protein [Gammaproteobacteria bacterium]|nr:DUF1499 domain-containing protein [Gammaproteobacteria bacterium]